MCNIPKNRSNIAASILQNPEMLEEVYEASKDSAGSAQQELDKYLDSITGKVTKLQNAIQQLTFNIVDSEPLKVIVDLLTNAVKLVNTLVENVGGLNLVIGGAAGILTTKFGKGFFQYDKLNGLDVGPKLLSSIKDAKKPIIDEIKGMSDYADELLISQLDNSSFKALSSNAQNAIESVKQLKGEGAKLEDVISSLEHPIMGVGGALEKATGLLGKFVLTLGNMAVYALASMALSAVIKIISDIITYQDRLIKKGEEAQNAISDAFNTFKEQASSFDDMQISLGIEVEEDQDIEDTISNIAEKYSELHEGVNGITNENISLTNDEYQQYLDTCNKLAEQNPSLVNGWDSQGNAILNLGTSADEARIALMGMYEAQQLTANVEIGNNLNDLYNGVSAQSDAIDKENAELDKENERLIKQAEWDASHQILDLSGYTLTASVSESLNGQIVDIINNVLGPDAYDQLTDPKAERSIWDPTNNTMVYYLDQLEGITEEKVQQINDALANIGSDANGKIAENTAKKHANELRYADIWASVEGSVSQYLQTSKTFNGINDQIQSAILGNLSNVDLTNLGNYDTILDFVYGEILEPMDGLNEEVQEKLAEAFTLDTSEISKGEYVDKIAPMLQEIFGVDWLKWAKQLGFQDIIDELQSATNTIYAEFGNNLTKEQEDAISDMSIDMLRNAKRLLSERSYEPDDFSAFWRDLNKKPTKAPGTGTLTDIFNDEGYSKEASTFTSNLSEIKTAIEQVGESGSVASDEVTKLLETEVKFDSFELSGLSKAGTDVLGDWIKRLHEMADAMDLSDDAMKDFDQYIASIVASYGNLLDIDPQKFITSVVGASLARAGEGSSTGQVVGEITGEKGLGERLQSENAEEILLLLNADGTLASGQIQQIVDQWDHYEILLNVTADAKEAERRIASLANDTAERSYREALNSSKEAIGEVLTAEDYSAISEIDSREYFTKKADADKALEKLNGITDKNSTEYYNASADYYNALTELTNLQVSSMERVKAQQESGANAINRQLEEMENTRSALDAQVTEATNRGSYADQGTYSTLAMLTSNMAKTQRDRYNFYSNLAENTSNKTWAIEWGQTAQEALNEALSLEADSLGYLVQPYVDQIDDLSKKYEDLSSEQSAIQDNLELREKKGYKTTARDYKRLLKNSKDQKKNIEEQNALLRKQRKAIQDAGGDWSDVQDQIESNNESIRGLNSSIFDYEQSIRTAALTEAQALASAIQTAMQEMASETGLSTDTILQLKQAFSDLKSMDISTLFYRTADGIKMSVNTLNTLIEAENTLKNNELDEQIRAQQEAMEKEADANGILTSTYHNMENELLDLMNIRSQYFATYQEQLAAIDGHSQIELAKSTKNPLDRYNQSREYLKEAYEMYEKGQIGSDDFKAIASYFDINGFSDEATFKANYDKYSKYFTEDATGLVKFWDDLVTAGVAAKDELGNYILTMGDVEKAAEAANVPLAVFQDIIMATNDYGADVAFVTSVQDGREQLAGLNAELRDEQVKLEQLKASGAEQSVIDKQSEVVANVQNAITNLQSATDAAVYSERRSFLEGAKGAKQLWEAYSGYRDDAINDGDIEARRFWEQMMRTLAEEYDLELKPGFEFDQEGYDELMAEVQKEINSTESLKLQFNVSDEDVESVKEAFDNTFHHNRAAIEKATEGLRDYTAAELLAIKHNDGAWSDGEKEIEEFAEALGLPLEKINAIIIALKEMGILAADLGGEQVEEGISQSVYVNTGANLSNRPQVSAADMRSMGYDVEDGSYATVFSMYGHTKDGTKAVVVTPILPNGDILEQDTVDHYIDELLAGHTIEDPEAQLAMFQGEGAEEQAQRYSDALHLVQAAFYDEENQVFQDLLSTISANQEGLDKVIFGDGDVAEGAEALEGALDGVLEQLGLGQEYGQTLLYILAQMGFIEMPELTTEVDVETEGAKTEVENMDKELSDGTIKKEVEYEPNMEKLARDEEAEFGDPEVQRVEYEVHVKEVREKVDATLNKEHFTPQEVLGMSDTDIQLHFSVSGAEEVQMVRDYVAEIDAANGYDLTVHIDETQMSSLLEAINPENPIEVDVDDEPWTTFVDEVEGKELTVTVNTEMGTPNPNTPSGSTPTGNTGSQNTEINASYNFDNKSAESSIGDINNLLDSLDVGRTYITVDGAMAIAQINAFNNMISNLDVGRTYITIDGAPAIAQINAFNDLITNGLSTGYSTINVDTTLAQQVIADFNSSIDSVHDGDATVNVSTATALRNIGSVSSALSDLGNRYVSPRVAVTGVSSAISQLDQLIRQLNSLNGRNTTFTVTRKNYVVGGHMDEGSGALGTAHALGGAFAFGNAYASGQNWGVPDNEDALVNEVGQESIVIFCDDIR